MAHNAIKKLKLKFLNFINSYIFILFILFYIIVDFYFIKLNLYIYFVIVIFFNFLKINYLCTAISGFARFAQNDLHPIAVIIAAEVALIYATAN